MDSKTGKDRYRFEYDDNGFLVRIIDGDGDITVIERAGEIPKAIVSADGQRTILELDKNGYLATITNPNAESHRFTYTGEGLMLTAATPRGYLSTFVYDDLGRLVRDENPGGGHLTVKREETADGHTASITSALSRVNRYQVESGPSGKRVRRMIGPDGTETVQESHADGLQITTAPDGMIFTQKQEADPRFGMSAPVLSEVTVIMDPYFQTTC